MRVYIVAGEPSGDLLASGLMRALRRAVPDVEFRGVGGESMAAQGLTSLFDIAEISVMGIFEVVPRLPLILERIKQTVSDIEAWQPDVLVTVDSWGFVSALLSKLRKRARKRQRPRRGAVQEAAAHLGSSSSLPPVVHYVAPQVWAWKKGRAKNVARLVDRLMMLLPDEGRYFEKYGLRCDFVGHPVVERIAEAGLDPDGFRAANGILASARVISVLPGSRHSEIKRLLPILQDAVRKVVAAETVRAGGAAKTAAANSKKVAERAKSPSGEPLPQTFVVVPTVAGVEEEVRRGFEGFELPVRVVTGEVNRYNAFAVSSIALAKSGTVSLELAAVGVPHLIMYKFNALSNLAAKLLVKIRFANIINLLADRAIIPEFVLDNCRADLIADCATELLGSPEIAAKQVIEAREVMQRLRLPNILPSDRAAEVIVDEIKFN